MDALDRRLTELEALVDEHRNPTTVQRENPTAVQRDGENVRPDDDRQGRVDSLVTRRSLLTAGGILGLIGLGADSATAAGSPSGQIGTSSAPLKQLYTEELNGGVTGGAVLTDLVGSGLSINSGSLEAASTSKWAEGDDTTLLEPTSKDGIEVDRITDNGSGDLTLGAILDLDSNDLLDAGTTIWDQTNGHVPQAVLENDSVTVAGNSVALGSTTTIAHTDLASIGTDDHHAKDHDHTEAGVSSIPNGGLSNSSLSVTAGTGLKNGGSVSLGSSTTLDVEPADFAGLFLSDNGSDKLQVDLGSGLENDGSGNIQAALGNALGFDGSNQVEVPSGAINTNELASGAVGTNELASGSVGTNELSANSVTNGKLDLAAIKLPAHDTMVITPESSRYWHPLIQSAARLGRLDAANDLQTNQLSFLLSGSTVYVKAKAEDGSSGSSSVTSFSTKRLKSDVQPFEGDPTDVLGIEAETFLPQNSDEPKLGLTAESAHDAGLSWLVEYIRVEDAWQTADGISDEYIEEYGVERNDEIVVPNNIHDRAWLAMHQELIREHEAELTNHAARIDDLEADIDAKDERIELLEAETDDLREENEQLREENEQLHEENVQLRERVAAIEAHVGMDSATERGVADD